VKVKPEKSLGNEGAIRSLIANWVSALRAKDLDKLMSHYAPGVVLFDGVAPLQMGPDMYRKNWEGYFNWFPGSVNYETRDLKITAGDTAAFSRALVYLTGTTAEGKEDGAWMRQTIGYEKIDGQWRVTHEHWSMPMDMESGKVLTDLKPE
jgi:uncharacterized protein (TIGR02246 family)